ncbi:hypothetical protein E2I00_004803 [Balaenoptera physalus]|uniref:Uncharacterized protein n=1 Tax=Balaenoptera physalus TaxID=9770 RepID=A0A6A1PYN4_BALPH|nr:hypothetical protein E2I00_004803 [Balaenoptera physalus]
MGVTGVRLWARPVPATLSPAAGPGRAMKVLLLAGLGALFFTYYWDDNFDPGECLGVGGGRNVLAVLSIPQADHPCSLPASLQGARVLLTGASVVGNCRKLGAPKVFYIAADMASPEVPERVVQFALDKLGRVPTSFSSPYSAAKFALNSFFGSLRRELDVQDVHVAITIRRSSSQSSWSLDTHRDTSERVAKGQMKVIKTEK